MPQTQLQQQNNVQNNTNATSNNSKKKRCGVKITNKCENNNEQSERNPSDDADTPAVEGAGDGGTIKNGHQAPQQQQIAEVNCQSKTPKNIGEANFLSLCMEHLQRQMQSILLCNEVDKDPHAQIQLSKSNAAASRCSTRRNSMEEEEPQQRQNSKTSTATTPATEQLNAENNRPLSKSARLRRRRKAAQRNKYVAIDCEMVGVGHNGQEDMLARVSIVNRQGEVLLDKFVKPWHKVIDYRTSVSGIRPKDIENGEDFHVVQDEVLEILQGKILVGHAIRNDLAVLHIKHPYKNIRDTARYKPLCHLVSNGRTPSLKLLSQAILGMEIQIGEHNSVEDARAAMKIYNCLSSDWEKYIQKQHRNNK